jgi:hypothetical protein
VSVLTVDATDLVGGPQQIVLDVEEPDAYAAQARELTWAQVRGHDRLTGSAARVLGDALPEAGYVAVIIKPHSVTVVATWPWVPPSVQWTRIPWAVPARPD